MFTFRRNRSRRRDGTPSLTRHIFAGIGALVLIGLVLTAVWHVTRIPSLSIAEVRVSGGETISYETIEREVDSILRGDYLKLIPHRFTFLYPNDAIASAIASLPRVKDVSVERANRTLNVHFTEYEPFALWCGTGAEYTTCYFVDPTGFAFSAGPELSGATLVRHTFDMYEKPEKKQMVDTNQFVTLHAFLDRLMNELKLRITDVHHTKDGDLELYVNGGGKVLVRDDGMYERTYENLRSVLTSEEFDHIEAGSFQYIDLRFGNKIFVNEEEPSVATSTSSTTVQGQ